MASKKEVAGLIMAFMFVVLGAVFISSLADSTTDVTQIKTVVNESVSLANNTGSALANSQLETLDRVGNGSTTLVLSTDYTVDLAQGVVTLSTPNASVADAAYDISYTYRDVGSAPSRTLVTLVIVFFAIAVFVGMLAIVSPGFRDMIGLTK